MSQLFARAIARALKIEGVTDDTSGRLAGHASWISALVRDLESHRGKGLVVAGRSQPPAVHALAHAINHVAGEHRQDRHASRPPRPGPGRSGRLVARPGARHRSRRRRDAVDPGGEPGLRCPGGPRFRGRAARATRSSCGFTSGLYDDETAELCHWHIPEAHFLETWSDIRAFDGTVTIQQPLIAPLYQGRSAHEVLAVFLGEPNRPGLEIVRDYWKRQSLPGDFEAVWQQALRDGILAGTATAAKPATFETRTIAAAIAGADSRIGGRRSGAGLPARSDDLGRPVRQQRLAPGIAQAADPADLGQCGASSAPRRAKQLGVADGDVLELRYRGRTLAHPRLDHAGPGRRDDHRLPRLWPLESRPGRDRRRRQRLRLAHLGRLPGSARGSRSSRPGERTPWRRFSIIT